MKLLWIVVVFAICATAAPWTSCGKPGDHGKITSLTISPDVLHPGGPFSIAAEGDLDENVNGGTVHVEVKYLGIKVFEQNFEICRVTPEITCPIKKGHFGPMTVTQTLPSVTPKGKYTGLIKMTDEKGEEIVCVNFQMEVKVSLNDMVLDDAMIAEINGQNSGWTAGRNDRFEGVTIGEVKHMLLNLPAKASVGATPADENLPESFDARTQWPSCIRGVRDQGNCGSCWAFALSESLTDRFCIASHGSINEALSPQYLVSCDKTDLACQGGYLDRSWTFASNTGISSEKCFPYESGSGYVPACITKCKDGSAIKLFKAKNAKNTPSVSEIQNQMYTYGPLEMAFHVYQDFMTYKSGVYHHTTGGLLGGHAIKCLGWGVEKGTPYWTCQNSWNTAWGDKGYFKILRGKDECSIESWSWAGEAAL